MANVLRFDAIGTRWQIELEPEAGTDIQEAYRNVHLAVDAFDATFSRFKKDSWVWKVRTEPGAHSLPPDAYELLRLYGDIYERTGRLVTPLVGSVMEEIGYDAEYTLAPGRPTQPPPFDKTVSYDRNTITTTEPVLLDFGAAGKGYLIDKIGKILADAGVRTFVINAGGDILRRTDDDTTVTIGLENPLDTEEAVGTLDLGSGSLCASAGSRRKWATYTHIINPVTLASPKNVAGTWVHAETAALADMLATALHFVEPEQLYPHYDFGFAVLGTDMSILSSRNFTATLFTEQAS